MSVRIRFPGQIGDPRGARTYLPWIGRLHAAFRRDMNREWVQLDFFTIALRVSGPDRNFGHDGPETLEYRPDIGMLGVDLSIPTSAWMNAEASAVAAKLRWGVDTCVAQLIDGAEKEALLLDRDAVESEIVRKLDWVFATT